jgi:uncharacterized membrane protein YadS
VTLALSESLSKVLLKVCVVGLGFGMDLREVVGAGRSGFLYTFLGICFGLLVTLYLIGSNISRATLKAVGARPLLQGTLLWIVVS